MIRADAGFLIDTGGDINPDGDKDTFLNNASGEKATSGLSGFRIGFSVGYCFSF